MTNRAAITWLILAAIFASIALAVNRFAKRAFGAPAASVRLIESPLDQVSSLVVRPTGQPPITFTSVPSTGTWLAAKDGVAPWPVEPGRISALLRVLSGTVGSPVTDQTPSDASTALELHVPDSAETLVVRVDTQSLGGRTLVEVLEAGTRRTLLIDDALRRAITGSGPMSWRDRRVFPDLPSDPTRIIIRMPAHTIELARIGNRWGIRSPIVARADTDAVGAIIRSFQAMDATRFIDTLPADSPAFPETSQVAIVIETATVDPATAERSLDRWALDIGGVSPQGGAFVARAARTSPRVRSAERPAHGPVLIELGDDRLAMIPAVLDAYLARTILDVPAPDVGAITLALGNAQGVRYHRTPNGWSLTSDASTPPAPVPDRDRQQIDALVACLADARSDQTTLLEAEDALPGGMTLSVAGLSGQPLETCSLFLEEAGDRPQLILRVGQVVRAYFIGPELAEWINARSLELP
jgi:hypothetical protein